MCVRIDQVGSPLEVLGHNVAGREGELLTVRLHRGHVGIFHNRSAHTHGALRTYQVVVVTCVPVEVEVDAVVQESQADAEVQLVLLLVGQCGVGKARYLETRLLVGRIGTEGAVGLDDDHRVGDGGLVTRQRVAGLQRSVCQHVLEGLCKPRLLVSVPCSRDVPCRQPAGAGGLTQTVATLVAHRTVQRVAAHIRIGGGGKERSLAAVAVAQSVVHGILLAGLLEVLVVVSTQHALLIEHTYLGVVGLSTVYVVDLQTAVCVDDVFVCKHVVVAGRGAEVPGVHAVDGLAVEAAFVEHRLRQCVDDVGVGVEPGVRVAHGGIVHHAERHGLVAVLADEVLVRGCRELIGGDGTQFDGAHGLILQLGLELHVHHVEVHVVVGQLMVNVERRIVADVEFVGIQRTRRVDGIRIGVDVEVALHGTIDGVGSLTRSTRSLLLTIGRIANQVQRHLLAEVVVGVDVGRIALHLALLGPSRVAHH